MDWREGIILHDYENTTLPEHYSVSRLIPTIRDFLLQYNFHGPLTYIAAVADASDPRKITSTKRQEFLDLELAERNVTFKDLETPGLRQAVDSYFKKKLGFLDGRGYRRRILIIIAGDHGYLPFLEALKGRDFVFFLFYPENSVSKKLCKFPFFVQMTWNSFLLKLTLHPRIRRSKPIAVITLIGWGESAQESHRCLSSIGNSTFIKAHGSAIGLSDELGNTQVGYSVLDGGRIFLQEARLCDQAISFGTIFKSEGFKYISPSFKEGTVHFVGLLSDAGVHSHIDHLLSLIDGSVKAGAKTIRLHILTDGYDVVDGSSLGYIERVEVYLATLRLEGVDAQIASGGGRMFVTLDRYQTDWDVVKRGWDAQVLGKAPYEFKNAVEAVKSLRKVANDQNLPPFVIIDDSGQAVGPIEDGDAVVTFNFRADCMLMQAKALENELFDHFDRVRFPKIRYAGMVQYDGELNLPSHYLVSPQINDKTTGHYLVANGVRTFEYSAKPKEKASEIAEIARKAILSGDFEHVRVDIPNGGDMAACQAANLAVEKISQAIEEKNGTLLVTAVHGTSVSSHTLVPIVIGGGLSQSVRFRTDEVKPGLANVAATIINLHGFVPPEDFEPSLIEAVE